jgi:hypothetical protein
MSDVPPVHDAKLFEKVILKILQKHTDERDVLNASQFGFVHVTA